LNKSDKIYTQSSFISGIKSSRKILDLQIEFVIGFDSSGILFSRAHVHTRSRAQNITRQSERVSYYEMLSAADYIKGAEQLTAD